MSGITHEWNGTILTITSDSGTSSMDLKGATGDDGIRGPQGPAGRDGNQGATIELDTTLANEGMAADAKAVGDAIDAITADSIGALDIATRGTQIEANTDLDTLTDVGTYFSTGSNVSSTLLNCPYTTGGFKLYVEQSYMIRGKIQKIITGANTSPHYIRVINDTNSGSWSNWRVYYDSGNPPTAADVGALGLDGGQLSGNIIIQKDSLPELRLRTDATSNKYSRVFHNGDNGAYLQNADSNGISAVVVCNKAGLSGRLRFIDVAGTNSNVYYVLHTGNIDDYLPKTHYSTTQPTNWKNGDIWLKPQA